MNIKLNKKKEGSIVAKFGTVGVTLIVVAMMIIMFVSSVSDIEKRNKADGIARNYILKMETEGCLTLGDRNNLIKELEDIGCRNISLIGTTLSKVGYGKDIFLKVKGDMDITGFNIGSGFVMKENKLKIPLELSKKSTAKN